MPQRARIIHAKEDCAPATDVLRFVPPSVYSIVLKNVRAAFDGQGAEDGFESGRTLSGPGPITRASAQCAGDKGAPNESGCVIRNVVFTWGSLKEKVRKAVFQRRLLARGAQGRYVGLGLKMRATFVFALEKSGLSAKEWLQRPQAVPWFCELSREGVVTCARVDWAKKNLGREDVCPRPGCAKCKRMLSIVRGVTQLACCLEVWGDPECIWLHRATHNSDEVRHPGSKRKAARATGRRLGRGSTYAPESVERWPDKKEESRPSATFPAGEPCSEPGESFQNAFVLQSGLSPNTREKKWSKLSYPLPASVADRSAPGAGAEVPGARVGSCAGRVARFVRRARPALVVGFVV